METMRLRKATGQSGVAGFWWENDGDVVEVPWAVGESLLNLRGAGFSQALDEVSDEEITTKPDVAPEGAADPSPHEVPDGTAQTILEWVGADRFRAQAALVAEHGRGNEARTSLIAKLEKLA